MIASGPPEGVVRSEGGGLAVGFSALVKEPRELARPSRHVRTQRKDAGQEVGSHQTPNPPAPRSWTSGLQDCEQ